VNFSPAIPASQRSRTRLPMTTMIDVVFLLLVFFMVTATMTPPESELSSALQVERQTGGRSADLTPQVVFVEAGPDGPEFVVGERRLTSADELLAVLLKLPKEGGVFVRVSNRAPVSAAAAALQASRDAGFTKVSYVPATDE